jgi:hypothetical protein
MKRSELLQVLTLIKANYRYIFKDMDEGEYEAMRNSWWECLKDYPTEKVLNAVKLALLKNSYPPTIADIYGYIRKAEQLKQPSDNELWGILAEAVEVIKTTLVQEYKYSCYRIPIYQLTDKSRCKVIYGKLPIEIRAVVDFGTFIMYGGLDEKAMSVERNRFLKAIPEKREAVAESRMIKQNNLLGGNERLMIGEKNG